MDKTFRVKLSAWYEALEAYKALESAMACKIEEQYDMLARLENVWYGKSAGAFQSKYRELLETGTYAESYKHIGEIRMLLEEGLPELVCMAAKCEQIPEQLACDEYVVLITRYAYSPHYNAGHVMLDDDYAPFVDQMCDRIQEVNQEARNLLDDIMAQCGDLIDFSAEKLENETVYRKINRVGNYKRAFDEYALAVRQFDENMQTDLSFVSTRYFDRNNALTYGQPGELVREPVKASIDSLATNQYLLSLLHKKDNELTETEKEYINLCYKETLENLDKETWEKILTSTEEISGIEKFNNAILEFTKDFDGLREKVGDYLSRSLEQIICGNFTEEVTLLGTIGQVLLGIVGVDLPCDIRDLAADFCKIGNGESVSFMQMGVDVIALIPIIGSAKYLDEAGTLLKKSDVVDDIVKHVDELVDGVKGSTEVIDDVAESVIKSGSNFGFTVDEINKLKSTVINEGQMIKDMGLTNDQLGPAIAGAYDRTTGKIYTAINDYDGKVPTELAPIIRERIENMPPEVLDSYIKTKGAGSHAEIYAANKLLLDNPNAELSDIAIYVNRTLGTSKPVIEIPFVTCPHCRYILEGFNIISNN